ncbi:MAG: hypothetical protein CMN78_02365 [Spirochaetales bacterium]|nr:hypothetical protein [Spirochaetales bacterium]
MVRHSEPVKKYLDRLYREDRREFACRAKTPAEFADWQNPARDTLRTLLGIDRIAEEVAGYEVVADISPDREGMDGYHRRRGWIETEPGVRQRLWLLKPEGDGPFPLAVTPHGHEDGDTYAGIWHDEGSRKKIENEDQDVAVQAVKRGFLTIAPATRGIGANPNSFKIEDIANRHGGQDCLCHNWQVILTGRSMMGERVWDLMKILDWALGLPDVDGGTVLLTGNSGGGMATMHTAAVDDRVTMAVPCCSYNNYISPHGTMRHCPCNAIPGIFDFGEYWDVAGLVAPRHLLTINGKLDSLHPVEEVDHAVSRLRAIYAASGYSDRYDHRFGDGGHRFFADLMWPWVGDGIILATARR